MRDTKKHKDIIRQHKRINQELFKQKYEFSKSEFKWKTSKIHKLCAALASDFPDFKGTTIDELNTFFKEIQPTRLISVIRNKCNSGDLSLSSKEEKEFTDISAMATGNLVPTYEDESSSTQDEIYYEGDFLLEKIHPKLVSVSMIDKRKLLEMLYKEDCPNSNLKRCKTKWIREVARRTGSSIAMVSRVIGRIGERHKVSGRPSLLGIEDKKFLRKIVLHKSPRELGVDANKWTGESLGQYLKNRYDKERTPRRCQQILKALRQSKK